MICWDCHWGWPEPVAEIWIRGVAAAGESAMDYGPAHIVWADENFDVGSIQSCITDAQKDRGDLSDDQLGAVVQSLRDMLAIPEEIRECTPENYDGEHPENFPPPDGFVMVANEERHRRAREASLLCGRYGR